MKMMLCRGLRLGHLVGRRSAVTRPLATATYTRDLPYSWDTLLENIVDPAHIPFAHHGLQGKRDDAIAIKAGWDCAGYASPEAAPCDNIYIRNITQNLGGGGLSWRLRRLRRRREREVEEVTQ